MKKQKEEKQKEEFISYEEARVDKGWDKNPKAVPDKDVEASIDRINPDDNSMESRG